MQYITEYLVPNLNFIIDTQTHTHTNTNTMCIMYTGCPRKEYNSFSKEAQII